MKVTELLFESPEARIEYLAKTMGQKLVAAAEKDSSLKKDQKTAEGISAFLADVDPTPNKKALNFLAKQYSLGAFKGEDKKKIRDSIELFFKVVPKLKNKDIMSYKTLSDLYDAIEPFEDKLPVSNREQKKLAKSDAEKIIDTPDFKVIVPKTEEAAKYYGVSTKWCTAAGEHCMFDNYNSEGPLYIIIAGTGENARKFQLHYETDSFMDERDTPLSKKDITYLSSFPQYKEFLNKLIDKHYDKFVKAA